MQNLNFNIFSCNSHNCCLICNVEINSSAIFCNSCYVKIDFIGNSCIKCAKSISATKTKILNTLCDECLEANDNWFIDESRSLFRYNKYGKDLILKMKNVDDESLYKKLTELSTNFNANFFKTLDIIIPIPLHPIRKLIRGFNQSQLIAINLSKITRIPIFTNVLFRKKNTKYQHTRSYLERFSNVENAFFIKNCDTIKNKNILLVDDVITTGATSNQCAKLLKDNSAKSVKLFTLSRTTL